MIFLLVLASIIKFKPIDIKMNAAIKIPVPIGIKL